MFFYTGAIGDAEDYDTDAQTLPWTAAVPDIARAQQLSYEYAEYTPWCNFASEGVRRKVEKYCKERAKLDRKLDFAKEL